MGMVVILLSTPKVFRSAFYEVFLHLHIALVVLILGALWYHLEETPDILCLKIIIALWAAEVRSPPPSLPLIKHRPNTRQRGVRLIRVLYRNLGRGGTTAVLELLPGDAVRVTLHLARPWTFTPGQHVFLTVPSIGLWTSHPFSLAWSDAMPDRSSSSPDTPLTPPASALADPEKGLPPLPRTTPGRGGRFDPLLAHPKTSVSAIIRKRDGFTARVYKQVAAAPDHRLVARALVEGPYGSAPRASALASYGTVVLVAGGVGITHQLPALRYLVQGYGEGVVCARRVALVWVVQSPEHLEWVRPWMTSILASEGRRRVLRVRLFVTRPTHPRQIQSPSATVQMFPGRPNMERVLGMECEGAVGAMAVSVCGPGALADEVRAAVRKRGERSIDLVEESFSW